MWSVFFVFLSYLDRNFVKGEFLGSVDAEKESKELFYMLNNTSCAKSSVGGDYHLHQVTDGVEEVRSVHNSEGRLVDCSVIQNAMQVKSFMHVCRLGVRNQKTRFDLRRSLTGVSEAKTNCNKLKSKGDRNAMVTTKEVKETYSDAADTLRRSKRGFTYPGTLWCGAGNIADHYDQLGEFAETDKCCRIHDHCPYVIHAFSSNYGYTNFKWHSLSHCDCDNTLKDCLRRVNDTSSRVVGQAFFNVIEVPCFDFSYEEQCVERHWYGVCKKYDTVPVAVIKESIPYDFGGIDVIDVLTVAPPKKSDKEKQDDTQGTESTTQSSFSESKTTTPEEPSLTNMVTAAEDFIKVLATVSTSQSSSADTGKEDTQTSEKKRKKGSGKKKKENKKKRRKGKGRKKDRKLDAVLKVDEGTSGASSTSQMEEVIGKNNFVEGHAKINRFSAKENNFINSELDAVGNRELSNKMMRDDPQRTVNESLEAVATSVSTKKELKILEHRQANHTELESFTLISHITPTTSDNPVTPKMRQRSQNSKTRQNIPPTVATQPYLKEEKLSASPAEGGNLAMSATESPFTEVRKEMPHSTEFKEEKRPVDATSTTQNTPIVRTRRPSLRQREERRRMKKILAPSTEDPPQYLTSGDSPLVPGSETRAEAVGETHILERLGLDHLESRMDGFPTATSSSATVGTTRNRQQSLRDAKGKRKFKEHPNHSSDRRVIKICYEVVLPAETDTMPIAALTKENTLVQSTDPEISTTPTFPLTQTKAPSMVTHSPKTTKIKRIKERGIREKKRKR